MCIERISSHPVIRILNLLTLSCHQTWDFALIQNHAVPYIYNNRSLFSITMRSYTHGRVTLFFYGDKGVRNL